MVIILLVRSVSLFLLCLVLLLAALVVVVAPASVAMTFAITAISATLLIALYSFGVRRALRRQRDELNALSERVMKLEAAEERRLLRHIRVTRASRSCQAEVPAQRPCARSDGPRDDGAVVALSATVRAPRRRTAAVTTRDRRARRA